MTIARTRKQALISFILALILSTSVAAQTAPAQKAEPQRKAETQTEKTPRSDGSAQTKVPEQKDEEAPEENLIIPPAPSIIKKEENTISIPVEGAEETDSESEYEERPVVSTSVTINSRYGYRRDPFTRRSRFHSGVDLKARWGDPIGASLPGKVQSAEWHSGYGNLVVIDHGGGVTTYYAHLSSFEVQEGDTVERGTVVGYAGRTGRATSPHLHYELRVAGRPVNPLRPLALDASSEFFK
ncbi:MAG: M23 family metallopeptidase [Blastocatellia bacterium]|nr:M23 family metallopeptidase [Blastocatellia bacterium]